MIPCITKLVQVCVIFLCGVMVLSSHPTNKTRPVPPRTRLLVIRPPPGTGQPNRVLIITDPRTRPSDADVTRKDPNRTRASDPFGINIPDDRKIKVHHHGTGTRAVETGGHPQSRLRRRNFRRGGQSLRGLLNDLRNQRGRNQAPVSSNIARISDTIPRAAPPVVPRDSRFGNLNIPTGIEAALEKIRQQAIQMGRMREQAQGNIQIPDRNPVMTRNLMDLLRKSLTGQNPSQTGQNSGSGRFSGKVGTVDSNIRPIVSGTIGSNLRTQNPVVSAPVAKEASTADTSGSQSKSIKASKKRVINSDTAVISNGGIVKPVASSKIAETTNVKAQKVITDAGSVNNNKNIRSSVGDLKGPTNNKGMVKLNASTEVKKSAAKAESNTTETKSLKTKEIKVTTVIKGGTAADVAAAAASQAEIANAVAQGKEINSSAIAKMAAAASKPKPTTPPAGSITVKREPNGVSVITLSDGQGEPVVLRASGPVKIERIIKPNGKVQFLINPVNPRTANPADAEVEPEDITTPALTTVYLNDIFTEFPTSTVSYPASPTFMPSVSMNPYFDSTTKSNKATSKITPLSPENTVDLQTVPERVVESNPLSPSAMGNVDLIGIQNEGLNKNINPLVNNEAGLGSLENSLLQTGESGSVRKGVSPFGMETNTMIPRPPSKSDTPFGPFDMLNSVIDFNKNIPRPSDVSMLESIPTTFRPSIQRVRTSRKKVVSSTDAMPQYNLVSSSPPLKIVPQGFS